MTLASNVLRTALFTAASFLLVACTDSPGSKNNQAPATSRRVEIGQAVPPYGAIALTGTADSLSKLSGKVVLLNVWATWCIPCRTELPDLQALHERYAADGLDIIGVSIDDASEAASIKEYAVERGVTYALWHDPNDRISGIFLANGVPATYLIGRDGTLRWRWLGPLTKDDHTINSQIQQAIQQ